SLRREVIPYVTGRGVGRESAGRIRLHFRCWIWFVVRKKIDLQKVRLHHCRPEPRFSFLRARIDIRRRLLARVARDAVLGENFFSPPHHGCVRRDVSLPSRSVREMKRFQLPEESCNIPDTFLSGAPENRML